MKHILHPGISGSSHHIWVHLIGVGGTGSHVLTNLAMINHALIRIERQPIMVKAFDYDVVTDSNIGRQGFSPADIGENKAKVMVERVNRYYGFQWDYSPSSYGQSVSQYDSDGPDIVISCVDSVKARLGICETIEARSVAYYWMDIGNEARKAQIILGAARRNREDVKGHRTYLPNFFEEYPGIEDEKEDLTPSCSAMESLTRQDLFINKIIAGYATHMLWQLLKDYIIDYRGMYINLETMAINNIPIL